MNISQPDWTKFDKAMEHSPYRGLVIPGWLESEWNWNVHLVQDKLTYRPIGTPGMHWDWSKKGEHKKSWDFGFMRVLPTNEWRIYKPRWLDAIDQMFHDSIKVRIVSTEPKISCLNTFDYTWDPNESGKVVTHYWRDGEHYPSDQFINCHGRSHIRIECVNYRGEHIGVPEIVAQYMQQGLVDAYSLPNDEVCSWGLTKTRSLIPKLGYAAFQTGRFKQWRILEVLEKACGELPAGHIIQTLEECKTIAKTHAAIARSVKSGTVV